MVYIIKIMLFIVTNRRLNYDQLPGDRRPELPGLLFGN